MRVNQLDVTTAYLNGYLEEDILMEPKELDDLLRIMMDLEKNDTIRKKAKEMLQELNVGDKICKLKKALYGLRQAGRSWHLRLEKVLKECGATPTNADAYLYRIGYMERV